MIWMGLIAHISWKKFVTRSIAIGTSNDQQRPILIEHMNSARVRRACFTCPSVAYPLELLGPSANICKLRRSETYKTTGLVRKALALLQRKVFPRGALNGTRRHYDYRSVGVYFLHPPGKATLLEYRYDMWLPGANASNLQWFAFSRWLFRARTETVLQCATSLGKVQLEHLKLETLRQEHCATDLENTKY